MERDRTTDHEAPDLVVETKELASILVKHFDLHEGVYELALRFAVSIGTVKTADSKDALPGVVSTLTGAGLSRARGPSAFTVDAAEVNPPPRTGARRAARK